MYYYKTRCSFIFYIYICSKKITSKNYVIFQKEGDVVCMYHCSEHPLYRHQHCVTVYLNKYKNAGR